MPHARLSSLWLLTVPLLAAPEHAHADLAGPARKDRPEAQDPPEAVRPSGARPRQEPVADPFVDLPGADMSPTPDTDLTQTWGYASGGDVKPRYVNMEAAAVRAAPNPIGFYAGVSTTGEQTVPPWAPPAGSSPTLTWPGFERTSNTSRVFFQISSAVEHQVSQNGLTVRVRFPGTQINVRNNRRALVLTYHRTPVRRVVVRSQGGDAVATLTLKRAAEPVVTTSTAANGYHMVVLEFADGTAAPTPPTPPVNQ